MCGTCGKSNADILAENAAEGVERKEESVPEELKLAYREELTAPKKTHEEPAQTAASAVVQRPEAQVRRTARPRRQVRPSQDAWLDKAIYIITALLAFFILRKLLSFV
jgi:ubiquitin-conjugating enzyme E2 J1